jgi:hypothetical protein
MCPARGMARDAGDSGTSGTSGGDDRGMPSGPPLAVPDDARELARDVAAWRREERWARRRRVVERRLLGGPASSKVLSAPLVITVLLAVGLLGATLAFPGGSPTRRATAPVPLVLAAPSAPAGSVGGLVPDVTLLGQTGPTTARDLRPAVLAMPQPNCECGAALAHVAQQAGAAGLTIYLIGSRAQQAELQALAAHAGAARVEVMLEQDATLTTAFSLGPLSAVAVHADGVIEVIVASVVRTTSLDVVLSGLKQPAHAGA